MFNIYLLGTGGMMPLPYHWLTSTMACYNGSSLLIDYGGSTQIALRKEGWSSYPIDVICLTHYHADRISGLSGPPLTMSNAEYTEPLLVIGPRELERVVIALRNTTPELPFPIVFPELAEAREQRTAGPYVADAYRANHSMLCYGYCISIPRISRFDVTRVKEQRIPPKFWNPLQKGQTTTDGNKVYTPDITLDGARRGFRVSCCTDTRLAPAIAKYVTDTDLMICEGMYGEADRQQKAREHKHMTVQKTAKLASGAKPKKLWLTYYSPSLDYPEEYTVEIRKIFPVVKVARDGWTMELVFPEEAWQRWNRQQRNKKTFVLS